MSPPGRHIVQYSTTNYMDTTDREIVGQGLEMQEELGSFKEMNLQLFPFLLTAEWSV